MDLEAEAERERSAERLAWRSGQRGGGGGLLWGLVGCYGGRLWKKTGDEDEDEQISLFGGGEVEMLECPGRCRGGGEEE